MSVLLGNEGCDVRVVRSAEEALVLLQAFPAQIVVLDLVLPRRSGLLLARELKAAPATSDILLVAVSFVDDPNINGVTQEAGCAAYFRKPVDQEAFISTLADLLKRKRGDTERE